MNIEILAGLVQLPWWGYVVVTLSITHLTIISVTLYLHRCQAHHGLELHPLVSHVFRFWLWLTTGMVTRDWVAIHRKHHAKCETEDDPHSPYFKGIHTVLWQGAELYQQEAENADTLRDYGHGTPEDWLERNVYARFDSYGLSLMFVIDVVLFGYFGLIIYAVQMVWIPLLAAGVINGAAHYWGYRNYETPDGSTNFGNIGFIIGGEELHNNHHAYPSSAKFSSKWWELDMGWQYIRVLRALRLARVKRIAPRPVIMWEKNKIDMDTVRAVIASRMHIMARYAKNVTLPVLRAERVQADAAGRRVLRQLRSVLVREESRMDDTARSKLHRALSASESLRLVYEYRRRLQQIWEQTYASHEKLLQALQEWCRQAEATGIQALQEFARSLRGLTLAPVPA